MRRTLKSLLRLSASPEFASCSARRLKKSANESPLLDLGDAFWNFWLASSSSIVGALELEGFDVGCGAGGTGAEGWGWGGSSSKIVGYALRNSGTAADMTCSIVNNIKLFILQDWGLWGRTPYIIDRQISQFRHFNPTTNICQHGTRCLFFCGCLFGGLSQVSEVISQALTFLSVLSPCIDTVCQPTKLSVHTLSLFFYTLSGGNPRQTVMPSGAADKTGLIVLVCLYSCFLFGIAGYYFIKNRGKVPATMAEHYLGGKEKYFLSLFLLLVTCLAPLFAAGRSFQLLRWFLAHRYRWMLASLVQFLAQTYLAPCIYILGSQHGKI